jgi:hypothetical protein
MERLLTAAISGGRKMPTIEDGMLAMVFRAITSSA